MSFVDETANYIGNYNRNQNNPYSNTYNPVWRNQPNFVWGKNQVGGEEPQVQAQAQAPLGFEAQSPNRVQDPIEEMFMQFMQTQQQ